jgi:hypothetical protein
MLRADLITGRTTTMSNDIASVKDASTATDTSLTYRLGQWIQDPMGSIIAASAASIGAFGFVLSGTWLIHTALN